MLQFSGGENYYPFNILNPATLVTLFYYFFIFVLLLW